MGFSYLTKFGTHRNFKIVMTGKFIKRMCLGYKHYYITVHVYLKFCDRREKVLIGYKIKSAKISVLVVWYITSLNILNGIPVFSVVYYNLCLLAVLTNI